MIDLRRPGQRSFGEGLIEEEAANLWESWMRQAHQVALIAGRQPLPDSTDLSVTLFDKTLILQALQPADSQEDLLDYSNQLNLLDL